MGTEDGRGGNHLREEGGYLWKDHGLQLFVEPGTGGGEIVKPVAS